MLFSKIALNHSDVTLSGCLLYNLEPCLCFAESVVTEDTKDASRGDYAPTLALNTIDSNPVGLLKQYCAKRKLQFTVETSDKAGPHGCVTCLPSHRYCTIHVTLCQSLIACFSIAALFSLRFSQAWVIAL